MNFVRRFSRRWTSLLGLLAAPALAAGPGTLYFNNRVLVAGIDAPVFDVDCRTPLDSRFRAMLYVGLSPQSLVPVGAPIPFRDGAGVGYVQGGEVVTTPFPAGSRVYVEMRAWEYQPDLSDKLPPAKIGRSPAFTVVLGGDTGNGPPSPPADLVGLQSFCLEAVVQPPFVRILPGGFDAFPGWPVTFLTETWGTPPFTYQWRRNGADLPGANDRQLTLPAVGPEHLGEYTVVVANSAGTAVSDPVVLRFAPAPAGPAVLFANRAPGVDAPVFDADCRTPLAGANFVAQLWVGPAPEMLQPLGEPGSFGRAAQMWEPPGYFAPTWREVPDVPPGGSVYAQVRVWDSSGAGTFAEAVARGLKHGVSPVFLVQPAVAGAPPTHPPPLAGLQGFCLQQVPVIVRAPKAVHLYPGEPLRLEVEVSSAQTVAYQWLRNGEVLAGETNAVLAVAAVGPEHVGSYTVRVTNAAGTVQSEPVTVSLGTAPVGGLVAFANRWPPGPDLPAGLDAPVFDMDGRTRLNSFYRAQLYAGPTPDLLAPVGVPRPFGEGGAAGYWDASPEFREVAIPGVPPGEPAWVQVRVWRAADGPSFESATAGPLGVSELLTVTTGSFGRPGLRAPPLTGLQSFQLGYPPRITRQPVSLRVQAGEPAALEVAVEGTHPVTFRWWRDGVPVPGATAPRLAWERVGAADAGNYRVTVSSPLGTVWSAGAWLEVRDLGRGTVNFANRVLVIGLDAPVFDTDGATRLSGANFRAQLWGGPDAEHLLPAGEPAVFPGAPGPSAGYWTAPDRVRFLPNVAAGELATVQVRVWDADRGESFDAAVAAGARYGMSELFAVRTGGAGEPPGLPADLVGLTSFSLRPALEILEPPLPGVFFAGERAVLRVEARGDGPLAYQWQRNGSDLPGATNAWLELAVVSLGDAGYYQVRVSDGNGARQITSPAALVTVAPWPLGASLLLSGRDPDTGVDARVLSADGVTPLAGPNYVAQLWAGPTPEALAPASGLLPLGTGERAGYWDSSRQPAVVLPGLAPGQTAYVEVRVWDVLLADSYEQAVADDVLRGRSATLAVTTGGPGSPHPGPAPLAGLTSFPVMQRPRLVNWPDAREVVQNRAVSLEVAVSNPAGVTYQWYRDGVAIAGATGPRLEFARVTPADAGEYTVTVSNPVGSVTTPPARLTVLTPTGGGTVQFANRGPDGWAVPIFDADGVTPLSGARYRAELLVGRTPEDLQATGFQAQFLDPPLAGYFAGRTLTLSNVPPDTVTWAVVRAWDTRFGTTYEQAAAVRRGGQSEPFTFVTGGYGVPAGRLEAMKSFRLEAPEPPRIIAQPPEFYWVVEGTPVIYPVVATNYVRVYWERRTPEGWVVVPGAESLVLSFSSATVADAGEYRAVLVGQGNQTYTATATLEVGRVFRAGNGTRGGFTLRVAPEAGPVFDLEGSTNLADWSVLVRLTNTTGVIELTEAPEARQWNTRFYRVRSVARGRLVGEIAGFVEVELLPGFSLIGMPLIPPRPRVADLLAGLPVDTVLYKYYADGRGFTINTLWDDGWTSPDEELQAGEACLLGNPTGDVYRLTLYGAVPTGELVRTLPAGWSLQALPLPWVGRLDADLFCPLRRLEMIARWEALTAQLRFAVFADGRWFDGGTFRSTDAPVLQPGEGFWIYKHAPEEWRLTYEPEP